jgi:hypothetical protein
MHYPEIEPSTFGVAVGKVSPQHHFGRLRTPLNTCLIKMQILKITKKVFINFSYLLVAHQTKRFSHFLKEFPCSAEKVLS